MTTQQLVEQFFLHLGFPEIAIEVIETPEEITVNVRSEDPQSGVLIGYHGETLNALQRILQLMLRELEVPLRLDVNEYGIQKIQELEARTLDVAQRVLQTGESYVFEYLSPFDRRKVHTFLSNHAEFGELESVSEGERWERRLVIRPKVK